MRTPSKHRKPQGPEEASSVDLPVHDYARLSEKQETLVEHQTIPGFIRRIPHRWNMDELNRFGLQVGRSAEAMQIAYLTVVDSALGVVRAFPVPLLARVYTIMAPQFGWPVAPEAPALDDGRKGMVKRQERAQAYLEEMAQATDNVELSQAILTVQTFLKVELEKRRESLGQEAGQAV